MLLQSFHSCGDQQSHKGADISKNCSLPSETLNTQRKLRFMLDLRNEPHGLQARGLYSCVASSSDKVTAEKSSNMLQESHTLCYIYEMSRSTQREPYFSDPVFGTTKSIFHSSKTQILNSLTNWMESSDSACSGTSTVKRGTSLYALIFIITQPTNMGKVAQRAILACVVSNFLIQMRHIMNSIANIGTLRSDLHVSWHQQKHWY